jgi:O-antigen/teichoic acid export membrane protein
MSLLLTVVFVTLAVPITVVTLGLDLAASAPILALLAWSIPLSFANQLYESALLAVGRQGIAAVGLATGFVISLAASWFYLIPHHQAMGVAWGIILAEAVALVFCLGGLLPYFDKRRLLVNGCQFAAATGAALGAAYLLRDQPDWLAGGVAIVTFIVVVLASGTFSAKELEAATTMLTFDKRLRWIRHRIFGAHAGSAPESPTGGAEPHHD